MRMVIQCIFLTLIVTSCSNDIESTRPEYNTLSESVYASISIIPEDMYKVYSTTPGILQDIFIEEGDQIMKGQKVARIRALNSETRLSNANLDLELAEAQYKGDSNNLKSISVEIAAARKQLSLDSMTYHRKNVLWAKEIGAKIDLDNAKLKYDLSKNNLERLIKKYEQTQIQLDLQYQKSLNSLDKVKSDLSDYIVRSRITGTVYQLFKEAGEFVNTQEPLAQIGRSNNFMIKMIIDEVDVANVQVGQIAYLSLEAYEGEIYTAEINRILPLKDDRPQTFAVEATFTDPPAVLYAGLSGEANILVSPPREALTIPIDYLIDNSKVATADGEIPIIIGAKNITNVEVLSGIDTSTVLIKPQIR